MIGQTLSHYRILEKVGAGGMGVVYRARDERLDRDVALKVLPAGALADEAVRRRFRKEALALSQLNHPNIATVYDFDTDAGVDFLVMELVPGAPLSARLAGALPERECLRLGVQLAEGLAAAHETGVVHRDVKPGNIHVTPDARLKILDFGLARLSRPASDTAPTETVTETATVAGTLPYMAPEQLRGEQVDARSDIYAVGAVLYEMATGRRAFAQNNGPLLIDAILHQPPGPPSGASRNVSPGFETVVLKCLDKDPGRRYQSARELRVDLERLSAPVQAFPEARPRRRQQVLVVGALAGLLVLVVALTVGRWPAALRARLSGPAAPGRIESLAVLPLKSLQREAGDSDLGLGIADTIITKISQTGAVTVRPTSAVRKYSSLDAESLKAAGELEVDAVLDGTVQRAGDRLRVNVNLLRVQDGASLWSESFDASFNDIFAIQDQVSQQVAAHLRLRLNAAEQARLAKRHTVNAKAYEYYLKGVASFVKRTMSPASRPDVDAAIAMFQKAIEIDPNYALAYAQLAYGYAWLAIFQEPNSVWIEPAKRALSQASALDPDLAEAHVARHFMLYSAYEGFKIVPAQRELRLAQRINPSLGHFELGSFYIHLGLEQAITELERAIEIDPTAELYRGELVNAYTFLGRNDEAIALFQKFFGRPGPWDAYINTNRLEEAQRVIDRNPGDWLGRALLFAMRGRFREADAELQPITDAGRNARWFHHTAHTLARIYALEGKSQLAVDWLRKSADAGMPSYPLFARDRHLDRIRNDPAFIQFMTELRTRWEGYQREFQ